MRGRGLHGRSRRAVLIAVLVAVSGAIVAVPRRPSAAGAFAADFVDETVIEGLDDPTNVEFAPDGRVYVAEKAGIVKVYDDLDDPTPAVAADLRTETHNWYDRGLLAIELAPDFATSRELYALHTYDGPGPGTAPAYGNSQSPGDPADDCRGREQGECLATGRVVQLTMPAAGAADQHQRGQDVILHGWCEPNRSHSVGDMEFGPDGSLYVSHGEAAWGTYVNYGQDPQNNLGHAPNPCGDADQPAGTWLTAPSAQGGMLRAQDPRTPADPYTIDGTVIRIDPRTGAGVRGNPLFSKADANARRIVAYGFRNPYRITLRPGTDDLYVGDVGWKNWEEIDRVPNPALATDPSDPKAGRADNFGWPCFEGAGRLAGFDTANLTICENLYVDTTDPAVAPLLTYGHDAKVVSGGACPAGDQGAISGMEFYDGNTYGVEYAGALFFVDYTRGCLFAVRAGAGGVPKPGTVEEIMRIGFAVDLEAGPGGDLFYVDFFAGELHRIRRQVAGGPPLAALEASPRYGPLPLSVQMDASASSDPDGTADLAYDWDLDGDGTYEITGAGPTWTREYTTAGVRTVRVRVTDPTGQFDTASVTIAPGESPPVPRITAPSTSTRWSVGDVLRFGGSATDAQDGALGPAALDWSIELDHCPGGAVCHIHDVSGLSGVASGTVAAPDHEMTSRLRITLRATDSVGLTGKAVVVVDPKTVDVDLRSRPTGVEVAVNGDPQLTPHVEESIRGATNSIAAPERTVGGAPFRSWSDGGDRVRVINPTTDVTLLADYTGGSPVVRPNNSGSGYWLLEEDGDVTAYGDAPDLGGVAAAASDRARPVAIAAHPAGTGFWVLMSDGRVVPRGGAADLGSVDLGALTKPGERVSTLSADAAGSGLWVFTTAGRVLSLGRALPAERMAGAADVVALDLDGPVVDSVATATGAGAFMVASDGGVFSIGDARFVDSVRGALTELFGPPGLPDQPVVGVAPDPDGSGYWLVGADGGAFSFDAPFRGALPALVAFDDLVAPIDGIVPYGDGYLMIASDGGVFVFSDRPFDGSGVGVLDSPVIGVAAFG